MRGGLGIDTASYSGISAGIRVQIGDGPGDGEPGEGDDVQTDNVEGGEGDDVLIGNEVGNMLDGGPGVDDLSGREGDDELFGERMRCGRGLDVATLSGPDVVPDSCEQLARNTLMRLALAALERPGPRRLRATVHRKDEDPRAALARGQLVIPCGPVRGHGTRCWRRVGRSHSEVSIDSNGSGVVEVLLSPVGRRWLRDHPRRRPG